MFGAGVKVISGTTSSFGGDRDREDLQQQHLSGGVLSSFGGESTLLSTPHKSRMDPERSLLGSSPLVTGRSPPSSIMDSHDKGFMLHATTTRSSSMRPDPEPQQFSNIKPRVTHFGVSPRESPPPKITYTPDHIVEDPVTPPVHHVQHQSQHSHPVSRLVPPVQYGALLGGAGGGQQVQSPVFNSARRENLSVLNASVVNNTSHLPALSPRATSMFPPASGPLPDPSQSFLSQNLVDRYVSDKVNDKLEQFRMQTKVEQLEQKLQEVSSRATTSRGEEGNKHVSSKASTFWGSDITHVRDLDETSNGLGFLESRLRMPSGTVGGGGNSRRSPPGRWRRAAGVPRRERPMDSSRR